MGAAWWAPTAADPNEWAGECGVGDALMYEARMPRTTSSASDSVSDSSSGGGDERGVAAADDSRPDADPDADPDDDDEQHDDARHMAEAELPAAKHSSASE